MQHKGSWRNLKGNEKAEWLMSEDLKDLLDKMFELDPVSSVGATMSTWEGS